MKLNYIANQRMPTAKAHGRQIMTMCQEMARLAEVNLFIPYRHNPAISESDLFKYYAIAPTFLITKLNSWDPYWLIKIVQGAYIKIQSVFFGLRLYQYFKNRPSDQTVFYTRDEFLLPLLTKLSKRVVWEAHALPRRKKYYLKYWQNCWKIVTTTQCIKSKLVDYGVPAGQLLVAADGVDLKIFDIDVDSKTACQRLNLPRYKVLLGYTGTLQTKSLDKGVDDILLALVNLKRKHIQADLLLVGGTSEEYKYLASQARKLGLSDQIQMIPPVPQSQLAWYQKACQVLLMPFPQRLHFSCFMSPLKMFEYMSAKRPIIASDLPAIRDILDEKSCLFCRPNNPADLASKIEQLLADQKLSAGLAQAAYEKVKNYTWDKRAEAIMDFIK